MEAPGKKKTTVPADDAKADADWLRKLYEEAWKQYSHEDNLGQTRTNFFIGLQAALLGILAAASKPLYEIGPTAMFGWRVHLGLIFIGLFMGLIGLFCYFVSARWAQATEAGKRYVSLRWVTAQAIEKQVAVGRKYGLATVEGRWRESSDADGFRPFADDEQLRHLSVPARVPSGGWQSMLQVIRSWQIVCRTIFACGVALILLGALAFANREPAASTPGKGGAESTSAAPH
jgi:hypothetical protein